MSKKIFSLCISILLIFSLTTSTWAAYADNSSPAYRVRVINVVTREVFSDTVGIKLADFENSYGVNVDVLRISLENMEDNYLYTAVKSFYEFDPSVNPSEVTMYIYNMNNMKGAKAKSALTIDEQIFEAELCVENFNGKDLNSEVIENLKTESAQRKALSAADNIDSNIVAGASAVENWDYGMRYITSTSVEFISEYANDTYLHSSSVNNLINGAQSYSGLVNPGKISYAKLGTYSLGSYYSDNFAYAKSAIA